MKCSLCNLTLALLLAGRLASGQEPLASQLMAEAARRVDAETSIAADVRYRVDAFGHQLLGTGSYLQSGAGAARQLRLDLRMQVGDKPAMYQEIRDLDYYWIRRDVPPNAPTLGRVDLVVLRRALRPKQLTADDALPRGAWIMLGGLPRLLTALDRSFDFAAPRADEVQLAGAGGAVQRLPIWVLSGKWKPARLASLTGKEGGKDLPDQIPDRVEVILDRSDKILPLFPYRISYFRAPEASAARGDGELLTLELFNVRRVGPIDPREFQYTPGEQEEVLDHTAAYIQQLGGDVKRR